jgi:hypothetical protein
MGSVRLRVALSLLFVVLWAAPFYVFAGTSDGSSGEPTAVVEAAILAFYGTLTILTGVAVGWPALVLPFVTYAVLLPLGVDPADSDGWTYAWLYAIPWGFVSFLVLFGSSVVNAIIYVPQRRRQRA